jgi:hypothetical protein
MYLAPVLPGGGCGPYSTSSFNLFYKIILKQKPRKIKKKGGKKIKFEKIRTFQCYKGSQFLDM